MISLDFFKFTLFCFFHTNIFRTLTGSSVYIVTFFSGYFRYRKVCRVTFLAEVNNYLLLPFDLVLSVFNFCMKSFTSHSVVC